MQSAGVVSADVRPPNYIIAGCEVCHSFLSSGMDRCHLLIFNDRCASNNFTSSPCSTCRPPLREGVRAPLAASLERAAPFSILPEQLNRLRRGPHVVCVIAVSTSSIEAHSRSLFPATGFNRFGLHPRVLEGTSPLIMLLDVNLSARLVFQLIASVGMLMDWPPWVALVHSLRGDGDTKERLEAREIQLQAIRLLCFSLVHCSYWSHWRVVAMSEGAAMSGDVLLTPGDRICIANKRHRLLHGTRGTSAPPFGISNNAAMDLLSPAVTAAHNMLVTLHCSSRQADVLTVRYGVLLHKLRSYYELDVTRLGAFYRVASLVGRLDLEEVGLRLSMPSIKWGKIQRLIDNLWSHIGLLDSSTASRSNINIKGTSSLGNNDTGPISGVDMLQGEARLEKEQLAQHLLGAQHEARFLQWLSSSLSPHVDGTTSRSSSSSASKDAVVGPSPPRMRDSSNTDRMMHDSGGSDDRSDVLLDRAVGDSASAMGALEEAVLDLVDGHAFSMLEMEELSRMIDRELSTDGLTEETVDELFVDDSSNCEDACTADGKGDEDNVRGCHSEVERSNSILLAHHCELSSRTDHSMVFRRYLQQTLLSTDMSSVDEQLRHGHGKQLLHLRSLHQQTLRRTSAACAKYSPFDIVWKALG